ncbi:uncharacterized protein LOC131164522 [Malania oleifera]|uniref:uncharacterized protein LOC131164522 n=1 Tax=Malania oleifera TaxID=397392 RepID=UPI0025AE3D1F|nr:uncharacterized protein LOC131164522 [Malania oleifera]
MVGIFSRFSASRTGHRRAQSALDAREVLSSVSEAPNVATIAAVAAAAAAHGIEIAVEFKPVEHPTEPPDNDQPVQCPLPEPSILNDGRIWKERVSASVRRADIPVLKEGASLESEAEETKPQRSQSARLMLPSLSAPEHNLLNLLDECKASGI